METRLQKTEIADIQMVIQLKEELEHLNKQALVVEEKKRLVNNLISILEKKLEGNAVALKMLKSGGMSYNKNANKFEVYQMVEGKKKYVGLLPS